MGGLVYELNLKNKPECENITTNLEITEKNLINDSIVESMPIKTSKLKCFYTNARSLMNKILELEIYIEEEEPDIIGISESWGTEAISSSEINFVNYTLFRKDRIKKRGGGVLLYIKNNIRAVHREEFVNENCEVIFCDIYNYQ